MYKILKLSTELTTSVTEESDLNHAWPATWLHLLQSTDSKGLLKLFQISWEGILLRCENFGYVTGFLILWWQIQGLFRTILWKICQRDVSAL